MNYSVDIIDTTTGERKVVDAGVPWSDSSEFWWSEGNFGCDCNRATYFGFDCDDIPCDWVDRPPRFRVVKLIRDDGVVVVIDGELEANKDARKRKCRK